MIVTPKPLSRHEKSTQTLWDNVEKPIHDPDNASNESELRTTTVTPKMGGDEKKAKLQEKKGRLQGLFCRCRGRKSEDTTDPIPDDLLPTSEQDSSPTPMLQSHEKEAPGTVRCVSIASPPVRMIVTPKPVSRHEKNTQTLWDNVGKCIHDSDYASSGSEVSTTTVTPKMGGDQKKAKPPKRKVDCGVSSAVAEEENYR
jgi:hypothetical protein